MNPIQVDQTTLKHFVTFVVIGIALMAISGISDNGRRFAMALLVIALIYELLNSHGSKALTWLNGKI